MLSVEGPGKYLNDNLKIEEEKTEILAVMTCVTVMYSSSSYILKVIYFFQGVLTLPGYFPSTSCPSFLCHLSKGPVIIYREGGGGGGGAGANKGWVTIFYAEV